MHAGVGINSFHWSATCPRSKHSGSWKSSAIVSCQGTTCRLFGVLLVPGGRPDYFTQSFNARHLTGPARLRVTRAPMSSYHPRPFPGSRCPIVCGIITVVPEFVWFATLIALMHMLNIGWSYRFINSMPMVFAFRIIDCFFCMGPKVLFQVG